MKTNRPEPTEPNYLPRVLAAVNGAAAAGAVGPGAVCRVEVYHDDGCGVWRGRPCDCDPDVRLVPASGRPT